MTISQIRSDASQWLVHLSSGSVTSKDHEKFEQWISSDPRNEQVFRKLEQVFNDFSDLKHLAKDFPNPAYESHRKHDDITPIISAIPETKRSRSLSSIGLAIAATLILGFGSVLILNSGMRSKVDSPQHYETSIAEIKTFNLEDGSLVTLSADTVLSVEFDQQERRVLLKSGQAFFEVEPDSSRPFTVTAGYTQVKVMGTKFDVRMGPEAVDVSVLEGKVHVANTDEKANNSQESLVLEEDRVLTAGQAIAARTHGDFTAIQSVDLEKPGSWRKGVLIYENAKLLDVVADVNRYRAGIIEISDPNISNLLVTAAFRPDQVEQMLQTLARALPVKAVQDEDGRISIISDSAL